MVKPRGTDVSENSAVNRPRRSAAHREPRTRRQGRPSGERRSRCEVGSRRGWDRPGLGRVLRRRMNEPWLQPRLSPDSPRLPYRIAMAKAPRRQRFTVGVRDSSASRYLSQSPATTAPRPYPSRSVHAILRRSRRRVVALALRRGSANQVRTAGRNPVSTGTFPQTGRLLLQAAS